MPLRKRSRQVLLQTVRNHLSTSKGQLSIKGSCLVTWSAAFRHTLALCVVAFNPCILCKPLLQAFVPDTFATVCLPFAKASYIELSLQIVTLEVLAAHFFPSNIPCLFTLGDIRLFHLRSCPGASKNILSSSFAPGIRGGFPHVFCLQMPFKPNAAQLQASLTVAHFVPPCASTHHLPRRTPCCTWDAKFSGDANVEEVKAKCHLDSRKASLYMTTFTCLTLFHLESFSSVNAAFLSVG